MGSAVLYLAWLASGRLDGYWELRLGPWDVAAGSLLVEQAGGRVTNLAGSALDIDTPTLVASNGRIHAAILPCYKRSGEGSRRDALRLQAPRSLRCRSGTERPSGDRRGENLAPGARH
jgi:hypothetical protein